MLISINGENVQTESNKNKIEGKVSKRERNGYRLRRRNKEIMTRAKDYYYYYYIISSINIIMIYILIKKYLKRQCAALAWYITRWVIPGVIKVLWVVSKSLKEKKGKLGVDLKLSKGWYWIQLVYQIEYFNILETSFVRQLFFITSPVTRLKIQTWLRIIKWM